MTHSPLHSTNPFRPTSPAGRRATLLLLVSLAALALFYLAVALGVRGGETLLDAPLLTIPILTCAGTAIGAMISGFVGILRQGERSIPVVFAILFGLLVSMFILGEVLTPH